MSIWLTDTERETGKEEEYSYKELKKLFEEYMHNQIEIKHLIKNQLILSQRGQERYKHIKNRQNELRTILTSNGVKP